MRLKSAFAFSAIISISTIGGAAALEGPGRALKASNVVRLSADAEVTGPGFPTSSKRFIVPYAGTVRVSWQLRSDGQGGGNVSVSAASLLDNSCTNSTTQTTYQNQRCTLRVLAGDMIIVRATGFTPDPVMNPGVFSTAFLRNVKILFDVVDSTGTGSALDP